MLKFIQIVSFASYCFIVVSCSSSSNDQVVGSRNSPSSNNGTSGQSDNNGSSSSDSSNADIAAKENKAFEQVNVYRVSQGLPELTYNSTVSSVCRTHSTNMANGTVAFGHDGFSEQRVPQLQASLGISSAAENVAFNQGFADPAQTAVTGWINSPGHEKNMTGNYTSAGMGVAVASNGSYHFTQIFVK